MFHFLFSIILYGFLSFGTCFASTQSGDGENCASRQDFGSLPLCFIENKGQIDSSDVAFYVKGADKVLYFTTEGVTFALSGRDGVRWTARLSFDDAKSGVAPRGEDRTKTLVNYFKGAPDDWTTGVETYSRLCYEDLWPGIDLVFSGTVNELKYEFIVEPGADPGAIELSYQGITGLSVRESGTLEITTLLGSFEDGVPFAYQIIEGEQKDVAMEYALGASFARGETGGEEVFSYGFRLGDYDRSQPLIMDPSLLIYCGYIGGSGDDCGDGIAVDSDHNVYIVGSARSDESSFPTTLGPDLTHNGGGEDAFVAKVNAQGTGLVYCGYIGGTDKDLARGIAVDSEQNAYVIGYTESDEGSFPVVVGPDVTFNGGGLDTFVAKLSATGESLVYCGYIGGDRADTGHGIALDDQQNAHVIGSAESRETTFPVTVGPDLTHGGKVDAFVAKVSSDGSSLVYCGYIGGEAQDTGASIALDDQRNAYVTGNTRSMETTFPVAVGPDLTHNGPGQADAFVAKVDPSGSSILYCGYIGGENEDEGVGIALDDLGNAYLTGSTLSDENTFPVLVGPDLTFNGWGSPSGGDAFVAKVNAQGSALVYCGFIGGSDVDEGHDIVLGEEGCACVVGHTMSDDGSFPVVVGPDLTFNGGSGDVFIARVNAQGTAFDASGFIGGSSHETFLGWDGAVALDSLGFAYVAGFTSSTEGSFPVIGGPDLTHNGDIDAFVAKVPPYHILLRAGNVNTDTGNPADVLFVNGSAGDDAYRIIVNPPGAPVTMGILAPPGGPNPAAFALYAWPGEAGPSDPAEQPYNIGTACFPMPLSNGNPSAPPTTLVNNIGYPGILGIPLLPGVYPAPTYIVQNVILARGTWTLQGIIIDSNSPDGLLSLTNTIVFVQQ